MMARVAVPTAINLIGHVYYKHTHDEDITIEGLIIAGASGMVGGGLGLAISIAAGGDLIVNAVWTPTTLSISIAGKYISYEW